MLWSGSRPRETVMDEVVAREQASGRRPYAIPLGGSSSLGAAAYAIAMDEVKDQMASLENQQVARFDRIIFASSSGGTHGGLVAGAYLTGFEGEILGISIDQELAELKEAVSRIATGAAGLLAQPRAFAAREISASADYRGEGYGVMGKPEREAISLFARLGGCFVGSGLHRARGCRHDRSYSPASNRPRGDDSLLAHRRNPGSLGVRARVTRLGAEQNVQTNMLSFRRAFVGAKSQRTLVSSRLRGK